VLRTVLHRGDGPAQPRVFERRQPRQLALVASTHTAQQEDEAAPQQRLRHRPAARSLGRDLLEQILEGEPQRIVGRQALDQRLAQVVEQTRRPLVGHPNAAASQQDVAIGCSGRRAPPGTVGTGPRREERRHGAVEAALSVHPRRHDHDTLAGDADGGAAGKREDGAASRSVAQAWRLAATGARRPPVADVAHDKGLEGHVESVQQMLE
jgi:hypothetical protein